MSLTQRLAGPAARLLVGLTVALGGGACASAPEPAPPAEPAASEPPPPASPPAPASTPDASAKPTEAAAPKRPDSTAAPVASDVEMKEVSEKTWLANLRKKLGEKL